MRNPLRLESLSWCLLLLASSAMLSTAFRTPTSFRALSRGIPRVVALARPTWTLPSSSMPRALAVVPRKFFASIPDKGDSVGAPPQQMQEDKAKKGFTAQFKEMWNTYGYLGIGFYVSLYLTTLSAIFVSLDMDLLQSSQFGVDPTTAVKKVCDIVERVSGSTQVRAATERTKMAAYAMGVPARDGPLH